MKYALVPLIDLRDLELNSTDKLVIVNFNDIITNNLKIKLI